VNARVHDNQSLYENPEVRRSSEILCISQGILTAKSVVVTRGPTGVPVGNRSDPESAAVPQRSCGSSNSTSGKSLEPRSVRSLRELSGATTGVA
jgi:hypothetical protein